MREPLRTIVIAGAAAVAAFLVATWLEARTLNAAWRNSFNVNMAGNEAGYVEQLDTVEDLLRRGCAGEALKATRLLRDQSLYSVRMGMSESPYLRDRIRQENPDVAARAEKAGAPAGSYWPQCDKGPQGG